MLRRHLPTGGYALIEAVYATAILGVIFVALHYALAGFRQSNRYHLDYQHCLAAAQAQLDCLAATAAPLPPATVAELWPNVDLAVSRQPGQGQWGNFTLVTVTAHIRNPRQRPQLQLSRYLPLEEAPDAHQP